MKVDESLFGRVQASASVYLIEILNVFPLWEELHVCIVLYAVK